MNSLHKPIDLKFWLNADIFKQQNFLKTQFKAVFENVGNSLSREELLKISSRAKEFKLSKGNDLLGFPYQVLDLIRDFDPENGVNIRILNWFGNGLYITVLLGKNRRNPIDELVSLGFSFGLSENQWDYPDLILNKNITVEQSEINGKDFETYHWIMEVNVDSEPYKLEQELSESTKKIIRILLNPR